MITAKRPFHRESYEYATSLSGRTFFSTGFGLVGMGLSGHFGHQGGRQGGSAEEHRVSDGDAGDGG